MPTSASVARRRRAAPTTDRTCTGHTVKGTRCRSWSLPGLPHCATHNRTTIAEAGRLQALTASVAQVQMQGVGWQTWRPGARNWQSEGWRLYDITGQLRFVANWAGNSMSRCRLYVAEVDESGEAAQEVTDPDIAQLASGPLGKGPAKDEALRLCGINLYVPGECYLVAEAEGGRDGEDLWFVASGRRIKRSGDQLIIRRPLLNGGGEMVYRDGVDLVLRVWTPHPDDPDEPDSPTRSAIPDLRELETIRKREFAELDSRLAGAGLLALPQGIEYPRGKDDPPGVEGFTAMLGRTMATSLVDRASAAAMVPIMVTLPAEVIDKMKLITFWSELSDQLLPMREAAITSLAQSLDVPPEILLGQGDVNHWSGWLISEDAVTTQIVPLLSRVADALTTGYLRGALEDMGEDPAAYVYAFDTAPLTTRPNRAADALNYHGAGLISDQAAMEAGAFREDQMPDDKERVRRLAERAVMQNPALLADPAIRELVGFPPAVAIAPAPAVPQQPPAPQEGEAPALPAPPQVQEPRAIPQQTPQTEQQPKASVDAVVLACAAAVRRALALAGIRLIPHTQRDRYPEAARHELHVHHGPITQEKAEQVLRGAWDDLTHTAQDLNLDPGQLSQLLHGFAVELLTRGMAYELQLLRDLVHAALRGRRLQPALELAA